MTLFLFDDIIYGMPTRSNYSPEVTEVRCFHLRALSPGERGPALRQPDRPTPLALNVKHTWPRRSPTCACCLYGYGLAFPFFTTESSIVLGYVVRIILLDCLIMYFVNFEPNVILQDHIPIIMWSIFEPYFLMPSSAFLRRMKTFFLFLFHVQS